MATATNTRAPHRPRPVRRSAYPQIGPEMCSSSSRGRGGRRRGGGLVFEALEVVRGIMDARQLRVPIQAAASPPCAPPWSSAASTANCGDVCVCRFLKDTQADGGLEDVQVAGGLEDLQVAGVTICMYMFCDLSCLFEYNDWILNEGYLAQNNLYCFRESTSWHITCQRKARAVQKEPEPNVVEIFKDCHTSKMKGMSAPVQAAVPMSVTMFTFIHSCINVSFPLTWFKRDEGYSFGLDL
ncbi:hypothetical protein CFC21_017222 [Triticum aestivum]|uniref:Uncharacterized protein n=2 Tax=Triticum aestivum TaxID=4565 RepID=A0A3B6AY66_WHEAT|nr:hypothetical protein CFC21_017222 [Triticum aestivum]